MRLFHEKGRRSKKFQTRCGMLNAVGIAVDVLLLSTSHSRLTFWTFVDHFIVVFASNRSQKTLEGKLADWVKKKKNLLNCKEKVAFQPNGCAESTYTASCFIHFGFGHCLDNIQLLKCTFVVSYSFVYLLFLLVS